MPSLADGYTMTLSNIPSKKRKQIDPADIPFYSHPQQRNDGGAPSGHAPLARKIHTLPLKKRARTAEPEDHGVLPHESPHHQRPDLPRLASHPVGPPSKNLSPCHICHRKPQRRSDLDSYKDCEGCGRRTCYICIRECQDWISSSDESLDCHKDGKRSNSHDSSNYSFEMRDADDENDDNNREPLEYHQMQDRAGPKKSSPEWWKHHTGHRAIICSKCCVETGPEGETMCLACLAHVDGRTTGRGNHQDSASCSY